MLVLSRKSGEEIIINNNIRINIVQIKGDRVRIGISAPKDVSVDRAEVHARRQEFVEVVAMLPDEKSSGDSDITLGQITVDAHTDTIRH